MSLDDLDMVVFYLHISAIFCVAEYEITPLHATAVGQPIAHARSPSAILPRAMPATPARTPSG